MSDKRVETEDVAVGTEPCDHSERNGGQHRMMPEAFSGVHIGDVDFDDRELDASNRITQRDGCVSVSACVEDNPRMRAPCSMDVIDKRAFRIRLRMCECSLLC